MPTLPFTINIDPNPADQIVRVIIAKAADPGTEVNNMDIPPPRVNPYPGSIFCPTFEVYRVRFYLVPVSSPGSIGELISEYDEEPRLDVPEQPDPVELEVGGTDPQDPTAGAGFIILPDSEGLTITKFTKLGVGPLPVEEWQQIADPAPGSELIGIELLGDDDEGNPIVFNAGEQFLVEFAIRLDSNAASTIEQLSEDLAAHIADTNNPHATTKAQVGLSNIPNAISDSINLNSSVTLATSKAVNDLRESITNSVLYVDTYSTGTVPGPSDREFTIIHGYTATPPTDYVVMLTLLNLASDWNAGNDAFISVHSKISGSFKVGMRSLSNSAPYIIQFVLIKIT